MAAVYLFLLAVSSFKCLLIKNDNSAFTLGGIGRYTEFPLRLIRAGAFTLGLTFGSTRRVCGVGFLAIRTS
jgi:hypothetical protein